MTLQLFKWLMALVVMVCVPMLLEVVGKIRKTDFKHSEEYLKQRVEGIYGEVALFYNRLLSLRQADGLQPTQWPDFDGLYCSADWNQKVAAVLAKEEQHEGSNGRKTGDGTEGNNFFSWSYWLCAEDYNFVYANNIEVIDHTGDQGTVALTLHNGQMAVPVLLNMVYERGDWYIDEITNSWNHHPAYRYYEWKEEMTAFVKNA